jgi:uncharacterized membrane protein YgcG
VKIAHEFFTYNKSVSTLAFLLLFLTLPLSITTLQTSNSFGVSLPGKIGRLNDYANVLTMDDQRELEKKLTELKEKGVGVTILVSSYDPFSDPNIYSSEVRSKWGIRKDRNESLVVFVQEGENWKVRTYLRPQVTNTFPSGKLAEYNDLIRKQVKNGEVRQAVIEAVSGIHENVFPPAVEKTKEETGSEVQLWVYLTAGISGGVVLLMGVLFWEGKRRCPRCGSRLEKVKTQSHLNGNDSERHCPECGYHEE